MRKNKEALEMKLKRCTIQKYLKKILSMQDCCSIARQERKSGLSTLM